MEAFFGGRLPGAAPVPLPPRRVLRRGAWSSTPAEEDAWVAALLSRSSADGLGGRDAEEGAAEEDGAEEGAAEEAGAPPASHFIPHTEIPKRLHFIWLGGAPLPTFPFLGEAAPEGSEAAATERRPGGPWNECLQSWARHHPAADGWTLQVWTERHVREDVAEGTGERPGHGEGARRIITSTMHNAPGYRRAMEGGNYGMASDILRLEILRRCGGVYVDVDYWCVASLGDVGSAAPHGAAAAAASPADGRRPLQFFCGASNTGGVELNNGLMGCRREGHPILWDMQASVRDYVRAGAAATAAAPAPDALAPLLASFLDPAAAAAVAAARDRAPSPMEVIERTGPGLLTRAACRWLVAAGGAAGAPAFAASQARVFPASAFHPFPNHLRHLAPRGGPATAAGAERDGAPRELLAAFVARDTRAVHLWGCSWQGQ